MKFILEEYITEIEYIPGIKIGGCTIPIYQQHQSTGYIQFIYIQRKLCHKFMILKNHPKACSILILL